MAPGGFDREEIAEGYTSPPGNHLLHLKLLSRVNELHEPKEMIGLEERRCYFWLGPPTWAAAPVSRRVRSALLDSSGEIRCFTFCSGRGALASNSGRG
jgi:hypothetical protein